MASAFSAGGEGRQGGAGLRLRWLESGIAALAPGWALRRARDRMVLDELRAYDAARVGRRTEGWNAGGGSANAEIGVGLARTRNRARDLIRNNEYATSALDGLSTNLVGTGILVRPELPAERALWDEWFGTLACDADGVLNGYGLQRLAADHWFADGEALVRRFWNHEDRSLPVPLQVRAYEPDHLDDSKTGRVAETGNVAILGKEFDRRGRCVAYWLFDEHPGELAGRGGRAASRRVPAEDVIHLFDRRRASQVRGISRLAVALMRIRDLGDYEDALLMRKKIEACFGAIVTTDSDTMKTGELQALQDGRDLKGEKVYPGMIKYIRPGESVETLNPVPTADGEWSRRQLHAIAVGCGMTYAQLTGDLSQANFASSRLGRQQFHALLDQLQWLAFIPQLVQPLRAWFREAAALANRRVGRAPDKITTPRRPMIDPLKDALAAKELNRGGHLSRGEIIRELGYDPDEVRAEIKRERDQDQADGLVFDTDAAVSELKLTPAQALAATAGDGTEK